MKTFILKFSAAFLLLAFMGAGCEKEKEPVLKGPVVGYIVGSFICDEIDPKTDVATGNRTKRGYCILLEGSENEDAHWPMDFYTFDLPPEFFDFPEEFISPTHNANDGGPTFFPGNFQSKFKIKFEYHKVLDSKKVHFDCGFYTMSIPFPWTNYIQASLKNISKVN